MGRSSRCSERAAAAGAAAVVTVLVLSAALAWAQPPARPVSDGSFGLEVVRVLEAIDRSITNKGREEHVGDDQ